MRSAILAFVFGVWLLQQQPALPTSGWAAMLVPFGMLLFAIRRHSLVFNAGVAIFALCVGFFWAAWLAQLRLADTLPPAWEGRDIQVVGVVASLPQIEERGERFLLDVEQVETAGAHVPRHISIARYFAGFGKSALARTASGVHPGERWRMTVRLKRPHGSYNPYGFDFEAWALERDIRATGYIRPNGNNARLTPQVYRPTYLIERARETIRERFRSVLGAAPYAGVLLALAIGDDSGIPLVNDNKVLFRQAFDFK